MNTYKKFLFAGFLALGALFVVTDKAEAAVQWNTAGNDCPTVMVANHTTQAGVNWPCWSTSVSANGGETVNVRIYYHNAGDTTATNTRLRLNPISSSAQSSFTFTGYVTGGGATRSGSGTVSLTSSQTLTLGSIKWYPNQCSSSGCAQTINNPSAIFTSNGVSVGDIAPGWPSQGAIVISFSVGNTQQSYQCSDGIDNDGDNYVDMQDPACSGPTDNTESPYNQPPQVYQCSDGVDNDGDGLIDYPSDPGCTSTTDTNEYNVVQTYQCSNGVDDDGDGLVDFPQDPGCTSATDTNEYNVVQTYQCSDNQDNDGDGLTDFPQDPGCTSYTDTNEYNVPPQVYQCNNGYDDDGDGLVDMQDPGCTNPTDNTEYNVQPPTYQCSNGIDDDNDGLTDFPQDPGCSSTTDQNEYNVVQTYQCSDNQDNDNDGLTDFPNDPGCSNATDNSEFNNQPQVYQCNNGVDDDGDGLVDFPQDPGCSNSTDSSEFNSNNNGSAPNVTTNNATSIDEDSATLRGYVDVNGGTVVRWFEWGEDDNDLDE
jgi:hypothetical protein